MLVLLTLKKDDSTSEVYKKKITSHARLLMFVLKLIFYWKAHSLIPSKSVFKLFPD